MEEKVTIQYCDCFTRISFFLSLVMTRSSGCCIVPVPNITSLLSKGPFKNDVIAQGGGGESAK